MGSSGEALDEAPGQLHAVVCVDKSLCAVLFSFFSFFFVFFGPHVGVCDGFCSNILEPE